MACVTQQFTLGVRNLLLGKNTYQKTCIFTKADKALSLQNKYFVMHEPVTQAKHYFWFNVDALGVDPMVPNATGHAVAIAEDATASQVATALTSVIDALMWASATQEPNSNEVEVLFSTFGYAYEARDAQLLANKTKFSFTVAQFGSVQVDLGATNGDVTFSLEEQLQDITSPQTGDFLLAQIRRGATVSVAAELKDTGKDAIRRALNFYGGTIVADSGDSQVITGYGTHNLFKSTDDVATQLILRAPDKIEAEDASEDLTLHKCKISLGELALSAENELVLPITANGYLDTSKGGYANLFSYGDASGLV